MTQFHLTSATRGQAALAAFLTVALSACSGGGGGGSSGSGGSSSFRLLETNVNSGQLWAINRAMTFKFTQPVDLNSVNLNTISVFQVGGGPAAGSFSLIDAYTVSFQPTCPTQDDFLDAGLLPGGIQYRVDLAASTTGGLTVRSTSGQGLAVGLTTQIMTPDSDDNSVLFDDTQIGPPSPLVWDGTGTAPAAGVSYIEEGGDASQRILFRQRMDSSSSVLGAEVAVDGYTAPLNLYSEAASALAIIVELDQPVDPSSSNIDPATVRLQYCGNLDGNCGSAPADWISLAHTVELQSNCVNGGATLRVTPIGILPLGRLVRVTLSPSFSDLVGNTNLLELPVASFFVEDGQVGGMTVPLGDEFLEPFTLPGSNPESAEDPGALLDAPLAKWGQNGTLAAGFDFGGTGGPLGTFDWTVGPLPGGGSTLLNTVFTTISNGVTTQTVVGGQVDVRNLTIAAGAVLEARGPNPVVIRASGDVTIDGKILLRGSSNRGVVTFDTGNLQESGASGNCGGGRGGAGNLLTGQSSPLGEPGSGPFDTAGRGGGGGETGYSTGGINARRGGGGGGGSLGEAMILLVTAAPFNPNGCPDQTTIGLDAEDGNPGSLAAQGAISGVRPAGGLKGPRPFIDPDPNNDFLGLMRRNGTTVRGELTTISAGSGGGGGGNAVPTSSFPNPGWTFATDEKGAGGGGGGGSITILCLGDVVFGPNGRIDAGGGTGGGGENTGGTNRVGSGSGGGSGGQVIIQVGKQIDFSAVRTNQSLERDRGGIWTRGGQGGEGRDGVGGAGPNGVETTPAADRLPRDHYTVANGGLIDPVPCLASAAGNTALHPNAGEGLAGGGGDGGPGIIQLHVPNLIGVPDVIVPTGPTETLTKCLKPAPIGTTITFTSMAPGGTSNVNTPTLWNQLLPGFGRISKSQSKWIPLGSTSVSATSTTPETTQFVFEGVDAMGLVQKMGAGVGATQLELPSILDGSGSQAIVASPGLPYITEDKRTVVLDSTTILDSIYLVNPSLMRFFDVRIVVGATTSHFETASAVYDETSGLVRLTVGTSGLPLASIPSDGTAQVSVRPRFFRVRTAGQVDSLPDPATIKFEFQATTATSTGSPNGSEVTAWTPVIAMLNTAPNNSQFRFFRFRVTFDLGLTELTPTTPVPAIEFLRIPFRF